MEFVHFLFLDFCDLLPEKNEIDNDILEIENLNFMYHHIERIVLRDILTQTLTFFKKNPLYWPSQLGL